VIKMTLCELVEKSPCIGVDEFYENGKFNFHRYVRSEVFARRQRIARQKLRHMVVEHINTSIQQKLEEMAGSGSYGQVNITERALEKTHAIAREYRGITEKAGIGSQEIGFFLFSEDDSPDVVSDIYIPDKQAVTPAYCDISGASKIIATKTARASGTRMMSWAHSHADLGTFFSSRDRKTLMSDVPGFSGVLREKPEMGGEEIPYAITASPSFVINNNGSLHCGVQYTYKQVEETPLGQPLRVKAMARLKDNAEVNIASGGSAEIIPRLIQRQILFGQTGMGGLYLRNGQKLADIIGADISDYESAEPAERVMPEKKLPEMHGMGLMERLKAKKKAGIPIENVRQEEAHEEDYAGMKREPDTSGFESKLSALRQRLLQRIKECAADFASRHEGLGRMYKLLKAEYGELREDYTGVDKRILAVEGEIKERYAEVARRVDALEAQHSKERLEEMLAEAETRYEARFAEQRQEYEALLASRCRKRPNGYRHSLQKYYEPLAGSRHTVSQKFGIIARILSGEYRGTIDGLESGDTGESEENSRLWKWSDRIKAVRTLYRGCGGSTLRKHREM